MNIVFFTQDDPFYVRVFFEEFFSIFPAPEEVRAVVVSRAMGDKTSGALARRMWEFYGPKDFVRMGARYAGVKFLSALPERVRYGRTYTVGQVAERAGVPVWERSDLNSPEFRTEVSVLEPDLFVSVASPIIFRRALIGVPRLGAINVHSAPLPRYRGMLPNFWQLYKGEGQTGITVHEIDEGLDTGAVLAQESYPVTPGESLHHVFFRTKREAARLIARVIEDYRHERVEPRPMVGEGSYFTFPRREHARVLRLRGHPLL